MNNSPPKFELKVGKHFSASATGTIAIVAMLIGVFGYLGGKAIGWW